MTEIAAFDGRSGNAMTSRSDEFLRSVSEELARLHQGLLTLASSVELAEKPREDSTDAYVTLAPTPSQQHASQTLLHRYRMWFERVRPFLDRSPTAPIDEFDEAFAALSSYFAMRRIGSGVTHETWRELFELESARIVGFQLGLLENAKECFALLNPRSHKQFEDLTIRFMALEGRRYRVTAESRRGYGEADMTLPFDMRDIENFILRHCSPLRGATRGWVPPSVQPYAEFGGSLFDALFTGAVRDLYIKHVAAMTSGDLGLRIRLRIGAAPLLAGLPWEYLYDGSDFVALTGAVSVARHLDVNRPVRSLHVDGPLRIAVTVSAPSDQAEIDAGKEVDGLKTALAPLVSAGLVRVDIAPDGTIATLAAMIGAAEHAGHPFHVWHFVGHGRYLQREQATYLAFESTNGTSQMHSGFELGTLLSSYSSLRVAVLNACEGARSAPEDSVTSVGAALVARGLPAAVAMQFSISDATAIRFAEDFYRALTDDGCIDTAVIDARRAIFFMPNESEWATPVIISRTDDSVLFDLR